MSTYEAFEAAASRAADTLATERGQDALVLNVIGLVVGLLVAVVVKPALTATLRFAWWGLSWPVRAAWPRPSLLLKTLLAKLQDKDATIKNEHSTVDVLEAGGVRFKVKVGENRKAEGLDYVYTPKLATAIGGCDNLLATLSKREKKRLARAAREAHARVVRREAEFRAAEAQSRVARS